VTPLLTPPRRRGVEILDAPDVDPRLVTRSLSDVALANTLFGGTRAVLQEVRRVLPRLPDGATLLDVGTGVGDIPARACAAAARRGVRLTTIGVDAAAELATESRGRTGASVCGDARALPFPARSVDVVTCSQVLHHFEDADARVVLREMDRVARLRVIVSDLRRSWLAAAGIWLASYPLGFHPVSRHDGVVSVMRGFTAGELAAVVRAAVGRAPEIRRYLGWRLTASWEPAPRAAVAPHANRPDAGRRHGASLEAADGRPPSHRPDGTRHETR
jgi:2-polyprenyl-3-methyl-5-hydroxy-6-metoxy-1,4-benzoquinol methylase